jgi:hypothetical protein
VRGAQTRREDLNREKVLRSARTISLAAAAQALTTPGVIRIAERQVQDARVDRGRAGPSVGDIEVVRDLLYNTHITPQAIGHGELVCTFTGTSSRICSGVYFLPKGKIIVGGSLQRPAERRIVPVADPTAGLIFRLGRLCCTEPKPSRRSRSKLSAAVPRRPAAYSTATASSPAPKTREGAPVGPFPEPLAAHSAAR